MKLSQLKTIVKEAVKEAIQEEMKDILMEAVRSPKQTVYENRMGTPTTDVAAPSPMNPVMQTSMPEDNRMAMRENIQNVLGSMMPDANGNIKATTNNVPLQMSGNMDTTSPNGSLPQGEVDMDQIMSLMKGKV
jgi:ATP-dependent Zn protease